MLTIYKRDSGGILTRETQDWVYGERTEKENFLEYLKYHQDHHAFGEIPDVEFIAGWPEEYIEWYGNIGIAFM